MGRVLFIEGINGYGEKFYLWYDRASGMWRDHKHKTQCEGYSSARIASAQLTRMRKRNFGLNSNFTVYQWGWQLLNEGIAA